jgi:sigma-B regulation protein RsbU (phosphoserine phosphatase)
MSPSDLLRLVHTALAADNPTNKFVTLIQGVYNPRDGVVSLVSGGHMPPLVRRADGSVSVVDVTPGPVVGFSLLPVCKRVEELEPRETRFVLQPGETLVLYTDGLTEAFNPERTEMFGVDRLRAAVGGERTRLPLKKCAQEVAAAVQRFSRGDELQDDQTLLLLRRRA